MARKSAAAKARFEEKKSKLESELAKYQQMVRDLRSSDESRLAKTKKQKTYHLKIQEIRSQIEHLGK